MATIAERIKQLRESRGLSQQSLADKIDVSRSVVGMYEQGSRKPSYEVLEAIADTFNVDMDYLMGKTDIERRIAITNEQYGIDLENALKFPASAETQEFLTLYESAKPEARQTAIQVLKLGQPKS